MLFANVFFPTLIYTNVLKLVSKHPHTSHPKFGYMPSYYICQNSSNMPLLMPTFIIGQYYGGPSGHLR
jgi:hypothetical protein